MPQHTARRLLYVAAEGETFLSHRLALAETAAADGFEVAVACPRDANVAGIRAAGLGHIPIPVARGGRNPLADLATLVAIWRAVRAFRPDVMHLVAVKPVIHGGIVSRLTGVPSLAAITGLGFVFIHDTVRVRLLRWLVVNGYRFAVGHRRCHLIFQNDADRDVFRARRIIGRAGFTMIRGSGTDLARIAPAPLPDGETVVTMPSRMLRDKGVAEFVEAARILRAGGAKASFRLLGDPDPKSPTSVTAAELAAWAAEGVVEWRPFTGDIAGALAASHIVALPSYREGFPKTLIDAAAAGRAMAASDVPGCRDAIIEGETGVLFPVRDAPGMARALAPLIADRALQGAMGRAARRHAEAHFDIRAVAADHLRLYRDLAGA